MLSIINTAQMQQQIGKISSTIEHTPYIVTNRGGGKMIILPYFDGCDEWIEDYMEDYESMQNKEPLAKRLQESKDSGLSDLVF